MSQISVDLTTLPDWTNPAYYPLYADDHRYLILYGGAGSGKSVFAAQKMVVRALSEPGHRFLILRKVARTLRDSVYAQIKQVISDWELRDLFLIKKSDLSITCANGSEFIFAGLDDVEKLKSITGITSVWIEEASEVSKEDFAQVDMRLRGFTRFYKQIVLSFNPISVHSWLKARFFDQKDANARILHTTYLDNRWLDAEYINMLLRLKDQDAVYYDVYALGKWGVIGNLILSHYVVDDALPLTENGYSSTNIGVDFGFNEPAAALKIGRRDGDVCVYGELYERGLTNPQLIDRLRRFTIGQTPIVADSAEPGRIKEMRLAGLPVRPATKGPGSVKDGIDWLRGVKLRVHPDCVNTIAELQGYKYREDRDGRVLEEPVDFENHAMDALRYGTEPWRKAKALDFLK